MPKIIDAGDKAPAFSAASTAGDLALADYKGRAVVLYFYPKDDTPGCTTEACDFRDNMARMGRAGVQVLGVSKDSVASHEKFAKKFDLPFPLISDADGKICAAYGTWIEKSMYGRKYMGIDRATFLIDAKGVIRQVWRKVKVPGHVDEVLAAVKELA